MIKNSKQLPGVGDRDHNRGDIIRELRTETVVAAPSAASPTRSRSPLAKIASKRKAWYHACSRHPFWRRHLLRPDSPQKICWDLLAIGFLMYTIVIAPMKIGFEIEDYCPSGIWVWEAIIDCAFVLDLLLNFFTATYTDTAKGTELNFNPIVVASAYLRSWFIIDLLSSMPIDLFVSLSVHGCSGGPPIASNLTAAEEAPESSNFEFLRMVRMLRLVKLVKILRVLKLQNRVNELGDRFPSMVNLTVFKLIRLLFLTVYVAHLLSCGFYAVGALAFYSDARSRELSWLSSADLELSIYRPELTWGEVGPPYTAAMYWTFTTITTVGFGDIVPRHPSEQWYAIACMIIGTLIFGQVVAGITQILESAGGGHRAMQARLNALHHFMREKKLAYELQVRIRRHFRFYWQRAVTLDDAHDELLRQLSAPLRHEVVKAMYRAVIAALPIFQLLEDENFWDAMLRAMQPHLISPMETLLKQGSNGNEMYLVTHGKLEVLFTPSHFLHAKNGPPPQHVRNVGTGGFVGEIALFSAFNLGGDEVSIDGRRDVRTATVMAKDHCELFAIERSSFLTICKDYPTVREHFLKVARERMRHTSGLETRGFNVAAKFARRLQLRQQENAARVDGGTVGGQEVEKKKTAPPEGPSTGYLFGTLSLLADAKRDETDEEDGEEAAAAKGDAPAAGSGMGAGCGSSPSPAPPDRGESPMGAAMRLRGSMTAGSSAPTMAPAAYHPPSVSVGGGGESALHSEVSALRHELACLRRDILDRLPPGLAGSSGGSSAIATGRHPATFSGFAGGGSSRRAMIASRIAASCGTPKPGSPPPDLPPSPAPQSELETTAPAAKL